MHHHAINILQMILTVRTIDIINKSNMKLVIEYGTFIHTFTILYILLLYKDVPLDRHCIKNACLLQGIYLSFLKTILLPFVSSSYYAFRFD